VSGADELRARTDARRSRAGPVSPPVQAVRDACGPGVWVGTWRWLFGVRAGVADADVAVAVGGAGVVAAGASGVVDRA
jgi:hypothetical protein